jgi:peptidylprolyl isomerase
VSKIDEGSIVSVHYIGTLDDGRIFDSTSDGEPLVFTVGANEVFPLLEKTVACMTVGEARNIVLAAEDAYGPKLQENIIALDRSGFPEGKEIQVGQKLSIEFGGQSSRVMIVSKVTESTVTLDGNHPLAGLNLTFALSLEAIN